MPIAILHDLPGGTKEQYEQVIAGLTDGGGANSLDAWPVPGILFHVAGPTEDGWRVVDVWESEEALQAFAAVLVPELQKADLPDIPPQVFPVHNFVTE
jgi:hypothetical protein